MDLFGVPPPRGGFKVLVSAATGYPFSFVSEKYERCPARNCGWILQVSNYLAVDIAVDDSFSCTPVT